MGHVGPPEMAEQLNIHLNPLGTIPKKDKPGKYHMDLSSLEGLSVNDSISKEDCSFHYASLDSLSVAPR